MPTYEYRCPKGHRFELVQRMSDEPGAVCPECGAESERILSGGAGFLFKGDGFYITEHRSDSYKTAASRESGGGEGSKGEVKPASKEEPKAVPSGPKPPSTPGGTSKE